MERGGQRHAALCVRQQSMQTLPHLGSGLVRKGDSQDAATLRSGIYKMCDPMRYGLGLPCPGASNYQKWSLCAEDGLFLAIIEAIKVRHSGHYTTLAHPKFDKVTVHQSLARPVDVPGEDR